MRKTATFRIESEDRDAGKLFKLTEMPASKAERWAIRAIMALARSGIDVPEDVADMGMAAIATLGFKALSNIPIEEAEPLLAEMFECVEIIPDPSVPQVARPLIETDVEEVITRLKLRKEVFELHTGFFSKGVPSTSKPEPSPKGA